MVRMISGDGAEMCASIAVTVEKGANGGEVYGEEIVAFHPSCGAQAPRAKEVRTVLFLRSHIIEGCGIISKFKLLLVARVVLNICR